MDSVIGYHSNIVEMCRTGRQEFPGIDKPNRNRSKAVCVCNLGKMGCARSFCRRREFSKLVSDGFLIDGNTETSKNHDERGSAASSPRRHISLEFEGNQRCHSVSVIFCGLPKDKYPDQEQSNTGRFRLNKFCQPIVYLGISSISIFLSQDTAEFRRKLENLAYLTFIFGKK